jgi:hypothetical protein
MPFRLGEVVYNLTQYMLPTKLKMHDVSHVSLLQPYRIDSSPDTGDAGGHTLDRRAKLPSDNRERRAGGRGRS